MAFHRIDFTATVAGLAPTITGHLVLAETASGYLLDRLAVERRRRQLTSTALRTVPVDWLVSMVCLNYGLDGPAHKDGLLADGMVVDLDEVDRGVELRQRGIANPDALRYVARVYLTTSLLGQFPVESVATYLDFSMRTASRWVAASRGAGFLRVSSRITERRLNMASGSVNKMPGDRAKPYRVQ